MEITAALVKELREKSGVAMMDCKKALVECDGDLEKAFDLLRSNSALKAEKKAGRVAADGVIKAFACDTYASLVEINTETDFAAKDSSFIDFTNDVEETISNQQFDSIDSLMKTGLEAKRKIKQRTNQQTSTDCQNPRVPSCASHLFLFCSCPASANASLIASTSSSRRFLPATFRQILDDGARPANQHMYFMLTRLVKKYKSPTPTFPQRGPWRGASKRASQIEGQTNC